MRILVVGAGAVGGYFGGRLLQAGRDVTFLVRRPRAEALRKSGLIVASRFGDFHLESPPLIVAEDLGAPFDLVLLSCKAYDLESAIHSFAAAVGPDTTILPLLNGMRHLDALAARFGAERVIGGLCMISATRAADGSILHLNDAHDLTFGELDGSPSARVAAIAGQLMDAGFDTRSSATIRQDMWEKWVFLSSAAAINCLMRASIGDIVAAGAADLALAMFGECAAIAAANGFAPREEFAGKTRALLTAPGSPLTASMLRDLEAGGQVESDAILVDMLHRANDRSGKASLLRIACAHVKAYEARRARNQSIATATT